jgi:hypothetical protein
MRVLVTFAVEAELAPWRKLRGLERLSVDGIDVHKAQIGRAQVHFVVTGWAWRTPQGWQHAVMKQPYQFCISSDLPERSATHRRGDIWWPMRYSNSAKLRLCSAVEILCMRQR